MELLVFALFSLLVPVAMIFVSKLLGPIEEYNPIKNSSYESAEAPIGRKVSIMQEYFYYFTIFIAFEITVAIAILWAASARVVDYNQDILISFLFIFSTLLVITSIAIARVK
ncbi:MAG: NADH-quinone oxidoreductase subunit A [Candidatus Micrarchaeia archaeon]